MLDTPFTALTPSTISLCTPNPLLAFTANDIEAAEWGKEITSVHNQFYPFDYFATSPRIGSLSLSSSQLSMAAELREVSTQDIIIEMAERGAEIPAQPITKLQIGGAMTGALIRDALSTTCSASVKYLAMQLLKSNPIGAGLTAAGVVIGATSGAYTGAGLARAVLQQSGYSDNRCALYMATGLGMMAGGCLGGLPSILSPDAAMNQIAGLFNASTRSVAQQAIAKVGPRIERSPTVASISVATALYGTELVAGKAIMAAVLPESFNTYARALLETVPIEVVDGALGTFVRAQFSDAKFVNEIKAPNCDSDHKSGFELLNNIALRTAGAPVVEYGSMLFNNKTVLDLGEIGAATVTSIKAAPLATRALMSKYVIKGLYGAAASYSPDPGNAPSAVAIADIVATNDSSRVSVISMISAPST